MDLSVPAAPAAATPLPGGATVGRYVVLHRLGAGAMGVVYRAYDPELDRPVALKLLLAASAVDRQRRRARLLREAQAAARLSHPNAITVYDVGEHGDEVFIAMELVDGLTLRAWLAKEQPDWRRILRVYLQAGRGLVAAHAAELVHRDFKPDNVLISDGGDVKVCDFGIAASAPAQDDPDASLRPDAPLLGRPLTQTGGWVGTPSYMAPEQLRGRADARSDQFSFCVALYEALYGRRPFSGDSVLQLMADIGGDRPRPPPAKSPVPRRVLQALQRGLRRAREQRFATMAELLAELEAALPQPGLRPAAWALLAVSAASLAGAGALAWRRDASTGACIDAAKAGAWDAPRRQAVRAAFAHSGVPFADAVLQTVERTFDDYDRRWTAMHTQACAATHLRHEQSQELLDLRMSCLAERRMQLDAVSELFTRADGKVVEHAAETAQSLPSLEPCADAAALLAAVPPPADAPTRARVGTLQQRLARVTALTQAARLDEALPEARAALDDAAELRYAPVTAHAALALARVERARGETAPAQKSLQRAWVAALAGRDDETAAQAAVDMMLVRGVMAGKADEGDAWAEQAEAMLERERRHAAWGELYARRAELRRQEGRLGDAAADAERAIPLLQESHGASDLRLAAAWTALADIQYEQAQPERALDSYQRAAAIDRQIVGPDHPALVRSEFGMANIYGDLGDHGQALPLYRHALDVFQRINPQHPNLAMIYNNLGAELSSMGRAKESLDEFAHAYAIWRAQDTPAADMTMLLDNMGESKLNLGQAQAAQARFAEALRVARGLGASHWLLAQALAGSGEAERRLGRLDRAQADFTRALAMTEKTLGADHPDVTRALLGLGRVALAQKDASAAAAWLDRARLVRLAHPGDGVELGKVELELARARWLHGDHEAARNAATAALATDPRHGDRARIVVAAAEEWLRAHDAE